METYVGYIKTLEDALYVFEACRRGQLNRVQRRLSTKERMEIDSGSIFAWDEREACMRRWTDSRTWSPSRVFGSFLTYKELDTKRRPRKQHKNYIYKQNGLIKQSFSIVTNTNQKLHLISYYKKQDILSGKLKRPSDVFHHLFSIPKGIYPDLAQPMLVTTRQGSIDSCSSSTNSSATSSPSYSGNTYSSPPSLMTTDSSYFCQRLPIQDIAWDKLPSTEDIRQLNALKNQLRIW